MEERRLIQGTFEIEARVANVFCGYCGGMYDNNRVKARHLTTDHAARVRIEGPMYVYTVWATPAEARTRRAWTTA